MVQKPIIHMQLKGETLPFDLASFRTIKFQRIEHSHLEAAKSELRDTIDAVLKPDFQVETPVTNARGRVLLEEHATPAIRLLSDQVDALRTQVANLESSFFDFTATPTDLAIKQQVQEALRTDHTARVLRGMFGPSGGGFQTSVNGGSDTPIVNRDV